MAQNLNKLRSRIAELRAEIDVVQRAVAPLAEREAMLRNAYREMVRPFDDLVGHAARVLNGGPAVDMMVPATPETRVRQALGASLAAVGEDDFVALALERAAEQDRGLLRMTAVEQAERLLDLRRRMYTLELDEEQIVAETGEARRPGANAAAVLGVPAEIAEQHGLLIGRK